MINKYLDNIFLKHPREHKVNYFQHGIISLNLSMSFFAASVKALIHSFIPSLFITSSTDCIKEISHFIQICYDEFTD